MRQSLIGESQDYIDGYQQGLAEAKDLFSACLDQPAVQQPNTQGQLAARDSVAEATAEGVAIPGPP